jgi:murein L,D-transpeptidase YcbB/YkuD
MKERNRKMPGLNFCRGARVALLLIVGLLVTSWSVAPASAQSNWWESIQGSGSPDFFGQTKDASRPERTPEELGDLRSGPTPWRSDVMLDAMGAAIDRYERIVANGGWPMVPPGRLMRVGEDDARVPVLRKRLRVEGDLPAKGQYYDSESFDMELESAVKRFQRRHGIRVTGRIERSVYAVLNVTAEQRLAQLKLNFDRLRGLMGGAVEDRYVLVNVPAFQLEAVERYEVEQRHRVIVGRPERQTPDVRTTIRALNFFPYWRVPESIARLDLVPRLQKEPDYLTNEGIRVYDGYNGPELDPHTVDWFAPQTTKYWFKQDPGEKNALGLVRLDMSNEHNVYMHDTPMKNLFNQPSRPFSAGCVRVQNVFDLVEWIARYEPGWDEPGRVRAVVDGGQALDINLTRPVPVYFAYVTAWAEPQTNQVEFRPDIYGRDGATRVGYERDNDDAPPPSATNALAP